MKISLNWLSEYITVPFTPKELDDRLTMLGVEVEGIEDPARKFANIVVGEVLEVKPHPNADKLRLTKVSIGNDQPLSIVCGAPNVKQGQKVAVATIGADLGEGFVIKKSKIRGEASEGMLCSERELGLSEKHEGIWELPLELQVGKPLAEALGKNDVVFEIGVTPNRADCLSHIGIAREISAITGNAIKKPELPAVAFTQGEIGKFAKVTIESPELCPRYAARMVRGVTVKPSPDWLKQKLEAVGLRPINNIVDVTNFVLMECGHPLHAFNYAQIKDGHVVVRKAEGFVTEFTTLDGKSRKLDPETLLICDPEKPLAIAGIMGGQNSEIDPATKDVLIESAYFNPSSIRRSSKKLGLQTDASYRFERGTDVENVLFAVNRAAQLIAELAGGEIVTGTIDEYPLPQKQKTFTFRPSCSNRLLGLTVPSDEMKQIFHRLNIHAHVESEDLWRLTAPTFRVDLEREEDAIEEIARVYGYDKLIPSASEPVLLPSKSDPLSVRIFEQRLRSTLLALGVTECLSTPMVSRKEAESFSSASVSLLNPLNIEMDRMRPSIGLNLLDAARTNERFGQNDLALFELGNVFEYSSEKQLIGNVREHSELAMLFTGISEDKSPYNTSERKWDLFATEGVVKATLTRIGLSAELATSSETHQAFDASLSMTVTVGSKPVGVVGRVNSKLAESYDLKGEVFLALLDATLLHQLAREKETTPSKVRPLPKYPAVERDIAIIVSQSVAQKSIADRIAQGSHSKILRSVHLFDEFRSQEMKAKSERSLAFHLVFRSDDKTLEEHEVDDVMRLVVSDLEKEFGARLRT